MAHDQDADKPAAGRTLILTRRDLLQRAFAAGGVMSIAAAWPVIAFAGERQQDDRRPTVSPNLALRLAQFLNRAQFGDLPPKAIEHAKMIIASTLASAAPGSLIDSARIVRELVKERGGKPEATVWFDGSKLPVNEVARVNAMLSDAAASDDSDLRNVAHTGTTLASTSLAIGEIIGATGQDILSAIVTGYEAGYLIKEAIERSGIKNTPETLAADRKKFRDAFAATSVTSPIGQKATFNADRETPKPGIILVAKNGQFVVWKGSKT